MLKKFLQFRNLRLTNVLNTYKCPDLNSYSLKCLLPSGGGVDIDRSLSLSGLPPEIDSNEVSLDECLIPKVLFK